ncbi:Hypothetical predicted protein, partial [Drosophila guanche]
MTHVNNAEGSAEREIVVEMADEQGRNRAPSAAGSISVNEQHRFLARSSKTRQDGVRDDGCCDGASSAADASTAITCLEDFSFKACQDEATTNDWSQLHDNFCIMDDELEYEDELELSVGSGSAPAAGGGDTFEQENEQLLME